MLLSFQQVLMLVQQALSPLSHLPGPRWGSDEITVLIQGLGKSEGLPHVCGP